MSLRQIQILPPSISHATLGYSVSVFSHNHQWYNGNFVTMTLTITNLILSMPAARIEMSDSTNKVYIGAVLADGPGDFHIYNYVPLRLVLGYFRKSNIVRLGNGSTSLQVRTKPVALQEWVNVQGFVKTSFIHSISLTLATTNGATSISFSAAVDNSGSNFFIGREIPGLTSNEFGIGHPRAGSSGWGFKMEPGANVHSQETCQ